MPSPSICWLPWVALPVLSANDYILFRLRRCPAGSPNQPTESSSLCHVTAWPFSSSCSPPGDIAPMQLLSDIGSVGQTRKRTFTAPIECAFRRTGRRCPQRAVVNRMSGAVRTPRPTNRVLPLQSCGEKCRINQRSSLELFRKKKPPRIARGGVLHRPGLLAVSLLCYG